MKYQTLRYKHIYKCTTNAPQCTTNAPQNALQTGDELVGLVVPSSAK